MRAAVARERTNDDVPAVGEDRGACVGTRRERAQCEDGLCGRFVARAPSDAE